jgi:hypothetical protein
MVDREKIKNKLLMLAQVCRAGLQRGVLVPYIIFAPVGVPYPESPRLVSDQRALAATLNFLKTIFINKKSYYEHVLPLVRDQTAANLQFYLVLLTVPCASNGNGHQELFKSSLDIFKPASTNSSTDFACVKHSLTLFTSRQ